MSLQGLTDYGSKSGKRGQVKGVSHLLDGDPTVRLIERITNNPTAAIVIGGLILVLVLYFIYR